jgi:hypothetical protein
VGSGAGPRRRLFLAFGGAGFSFPVFVDELLHCSCAQAIIIIIDIIMEGYSSKNQFASSAGIFPSEIPSKTLGILVLAINL